MILDLLSTVCALNADGRRQFLVGELVRLVPGIGVRLDGTVTANDGTEFEVTWDFGGGTSRHNIREHAERLFTAEKRSMAWIEEVLASVR